LCVINDYTIDRGYLKKIAKGQVFG